jgi:hypothetical protein
MSANTLTNLVPTIYAALDVVARERIGLIPAVDRLPGAERVAKDQTIRWPVVGAMSTADQSASMTLPDPSGVTIGSDTMTLDNFKGVSFPWTGEERLSLGQNIDPVFRDQMAQAMRVLANTVEADLAALYVAASRAYGTAATAPFGTAGDLSDVAQVRKILEDNGCPDSELRLIINTTAAANLRGKQSALFKVNEAGTDAMLRRGTIGDLEGFQIGVSGQIKSHTKGAGTGYLINNASGEGIGETTIALDGGTVNTTGIKAGDVVTFAGASTAHRYVVKTGITAVSGNIVLGAPGLRVAEADDAAMTIGGSYTANMAFHRAALRLAMRAPALPPGGDAASDVMDVSDPTSGLAFQVAVYKGHLQQAVVVRAVWGVKCVKPEFLALLLG